MPCRYVIHAVGPIWGQDDAADNKLATAIKGSLSVADELKINSIAFPAISTGIFGFPKARAAGIIFREIENYFIAKPDSSLTLVKLILYDAPTVAAFIKTWEAL